MHDLYFVLCSVKLCDPKSSQDLRYTNLGSVSYSSLAILFSQGMREGRNSNGYSVFYHYYFILIAITLFFLASCFLNKFQANI